VTDFRIDTTFFFHLKTLKVKRKLGASGAFALLTLWAYATENRPKGILSGMTTDDIEAVSQWDGEDGVLVACLLQTGFLDQLEDGLFSLHNWEDRNAWAFHSQERSEAAKKAATARWSKRKDAGGMQGALRKDAGGMQGALRKDAGSMQGALRKDAGSNAEPYKEECPSPSPSPSPNPKKKGANAGAFAAERFETFWAIFPNKKDKKKAFEAFRKLNPDDILLAKIVKAVKSQMEWRDQMKTLGEFAPGWKYGQGWINGKRWEDEMSGSCDKTDYFSEVRHG